jgi:D-threo-aldose 1-dehydrogenase
MTHRQDRPTTKRMITMPSQEPQQGRLGVRLSRLTLGTSWNADRIRTLDTVSALERVLDHGRDEGAITVIDTSNEYAQGLSERAIGDAIRRRGGVPAGITIATKLDRDPDTGSFSAERMRASLQESRERLGLDVIPLLYLHDPERISYREAFAEDGPVRALVAMKEAGEAVSIGISGGPAPMLQHYVETDLFDAVITHNRYTLVDRSAAELIDVAVDRGVAVVNAAVYGGGALARWPEPVTSYAYRPAHPDVVRAVAAMGELCQRHGVSLAAAALQFSTRDPRIATTVVGAHTAAHVEQLVADDQIMIDSSVFDDLEALTPSADAWQDPPGSTWPR